MTTPTVRAIPTTYRGTRFRSTLEADWAATFDALGEGWYWEYEPAAVQVGEISYRPDFHLPEQRVWCEVKGPHGLRVDKPLAAARVFGANQGAEGPDGDPYDLNRSIIVLLRPPGPGETCVWEEANPDQHLVIALCPEVRPVWVAGLQRHLGVPLRLPQWWREQVLDVEGPLRVLPAQGVAVYPRTARGATVMTAALSRLATMLDELDDGVS